MKKLAYILCSIGAVLAFGAAAQTFPSKPIRIIVPAPAASSADVLARVLSQKIQESWGQPVVVDNRVGDHNNLGVAIASKTPADGYTWVLIPDSTMARSPHLQKLSFDVFKDFTPVTQLATVPFSLVVNPSVPVNSLTELVQYAKANPGKLSYGSSGNGSVQHMLTELIKYTAGGIDILHVPYKGSSQTITDLVGGRIQVMVGATGQLAPFVKEGRLKILASAGAARSPDFPSVPIISEELPAFGKRLGDPWIGLYLPANVPNEIIMKINAEVVRILNAPDMKASLAAKGFDVSTTTPEALGKIGREDFASWGKVIKEANVKADE